MKVKESEPEPIQVVRVKHLDEDSKKNDPLEVEFTEPEKKQEELPSVSFFKLYRFSTGWEKVILVIGLLGAAGTGACQPLNVLFFGDLTGIMVDFGSQLGPAITAAVAAYMSGYREYPGETLTEAVLRVMYSTERANGTGTNVDEIKKNITQEFLDGIQTFAINNSIVGAATFICTYISLACFNYVAYTQIHRIRNLYLKSALRQDIGWYDVHQSGEFASRMSEDMTKLEDGVGEKVPMFVSMVVSFGGSVGLALGRGWELALVCLVSLPVTLIVVGIVGFAASRLAKREMTEYAKAGTIAEEVLSSIRTVIAFGGREKEVERYEKNLLSAKNLNVKRNLFTGLAFGILWFFIYASYALAFWYGVTLIIRDMDKTEGQIYDAATMITVFMGVMTGSMSLGMASPFIEAFSIARGAAAKVYSVIDRESLIDSMSEEGKRPEKIEGSINFRNVHFEYPSRKGVKILKGLNLSIKGGETVALVGSSGCGKSTCIQLIQRFYDPLDGAVELDGHDIRSLNVGWLRSQIGVVGQEPVLFQTTVEENIRYGRDGCTKEDIVNAAKMANAHAFISKLPQGYDTLVGERGAQLSGGQKQRIAIARALVRRPRILLLDEATSALDTSSEAKVQAALDRASVGQTTIIVAHRLSTIRNADKIVVIHDGRVVEQGSHDVLMQHRGHYFDLVTTQISGSEDPTSPGEERGKEHMKAERMISVRSNASSAIDDDEELTEGQRLMAEHYQEGTVKTASILKILRVNRPEWLLLVIATVASVVSGFAMPLFSVLFGDLIGTLGQDDPDKIRADTDYFSLLFVIVGVVMGFMTFIQTYLYGIAGEKLTMRFRGLMFSAMLRQEVAYFDDKNNSTGALCARLSGDAANIQGATGQRIGTITQSLGTLVLSVALAMYYEWRLGLLVLAFVPPLFGAFYVQGKLQRGELLGTAGAMEKATKVAVESVTNIRTVLGLCRERQFHAQYLLELQPALQVSKRNVHLRATTYALARSIGFFAYAGAMAFGGSLVASEGLPYEKVFKVSQALIMGTAMVANILSFAPNFQKGIEAASNAFYLLERQPRIDDAPDAKDEKWKSQGEVQYSDVQFAYPTRVGSLVLRGLDLEIRPGQTVALVGPSGCGKSTTVQLLERFYDPTAGVVSVDGRNVSKVKMANLRDQMGIVSQEPVLFDRTIAENIAYGDNERHVPMAEIIEAAKKSNIHNFISSLPQGYETRMGEKGTQLSGGQKQRVAIARALVRNPRILLLDEATSALDAESEKVVQEALDKAKEGRTCITIAHRLTTIQDADVICVINEGRVAELGKHSELLQRRGIYHKLHSLQGGRR
ncbi:ATP-dependent translocase ABCB1-like isoform X1 [Schistocerca gregaria]|uniref:ATP-dependent translocase ABCB1-like isoform X1 n=1 Tax=Schistocerca gregaria TaxID=7010 RepID=UPI00211EAC2A|nr:ATP-dependent translocase ABCB1-like isoform X1 [Schistocerca gregaria]XP_049837441.1 ATP-dependent translocase ABCB1-like isoform X1 [Schistocerca gregaria]XP_049837442.1 ATP-dependent translocase ABCB1-like isoform X1 [Schistocerca gregaria]XP_049837443.1 ATP-dependent translocase ABCB1-like isoform X1 [Schistocerca gregaria]XP_049837444.1 ATP-dependent translocase ABCB1-like isoform X1 [Schistocerca gregaria]